MWQIYPFDNQFFLKALSQEGMMKKKEKGDLVEGWIADRNGGLEYARVMDMLSMFWTIVHQAAFDLWTIGFAPKMAGSIYENHLSSLYEFFDTYEAKAVAAEAFIDTPEYCWISDGVYSLKINWERKNVLLDWKTYGAYKYMYGINQEVRKKDGTPNWRKDDFKKLSLQLAMYSRWFEHTELWKNVRIDSHAVVWVTHEWTFMENVVPNIEPFEEWRRKKSSTSLSL